MINLNSSASLLGAGYLEPTPKRRNVFKMNRAMAALHNRETVVYLISTMGALSQLQIAADQTPAIDRFLYRPRVESARTCSRRPGPSVRARGAKRNID